MAWYGHLIVWLIFCAIGFGLGILYKGKKIKPIIDILKDSTLSAEEKMKKIVELL